MFRIALSRLPVRVATRNISTTPVTFIKIRSSSQPPPPSSSSSSSSSSGGSPKRPSPAEKPPRPLSSSPSRKLNEEVINQSGRPIVTPSSTTTPPLSPPPPPSSPTWQKASELSTPPQTPLTPPPIPTSTPSSASASSSIPTSKPIEPLQPTETEVTHEAFNPSTLPSLDIDPSLQSIAEPTSSSSGGGEGKGGRTGASRKEYVSSIERQRRLWARLGLAGLAVGLVGGAFYMGANEQGDMQSSWQRAKNNLSEMSDYFNKPAFKVLLPDPLPAPHQRPYTLLVDMEGMLVSSSWDRASGWKTAKRPGVDYFLAYLSQFYEIVLFTSQPLYTAAPVAEKLDPYQAYLPYKLFRESTRSVGGKTVKDLTYLNRDLSKVILLDTNPEHAGLQPENSIIIAPWTGKPGDQGLVEMIPFLESIGIFAPADVRPVLQAYQGKDIPREYAKKEAEQKEAAVKEWERTHPSAMHGAGSGLLSSVFGSVANPGRPRRTQPMTLLEEKRAQAQAIYQEEQKYWRDHAEEFAKLIEEDKQKQLAEMKGSLLGYLGVAGGGSKPEEKK